MKTYTQTNNYDFQSSIADMTCRHTLVKTTKFKYNTLLHLPLEDIWLSNLCTNQSNLYDWANWAQLARFPRIIAAEI